MKKKGFFLVILALAIVSISYSCREMTEKLVFQDLRIVQDNNLKLEDIVDSIDIISQPGHSFARGHTNVICNNKVLKSFVWTEYSSPVSIKTPIFWAKSNDVYVFTGNISIFDLNQEIYVVDNGKFKIASMVKNDSISAIVPHQIKDAYINFKEKLISIKCDPNSGLATYGNIKEATGVFKY